MQEEILIAEDRRNVQEPNEVGKLEAVVSADEKGEIKTETPKSKMVMENLLKTNVDTRSNPLINFMRNFFKSFQNARNYNLYKVKVENGDVKKSVEALQKMLNNPSEHKAELKEMRINPYDFKEKVTITPEIEAVLGNVGLSSEILQKEGQLDKFLKYQHTDVMYITSPVGENGEVVTYQARVALRTDPKTNEPTLELRSVRNSLELDKPFVGYEFSEADKRSLSNAGNLGKIVELKPNNGESFRAFVSVDPQTNTLVYVPVKDVRIPQSVGGRKLTQEEFELISNGRLCPLKGLTSKSGKEYEAIVQFNAEKRGLDFIFPQTNKQLTKRQDGIPLEIGGKELTTKQQNALASGKTLYLENLTNRKTNQVYNSYVSFNKETGKLSFSRFNPEKSKGSELNKKVEQKGGLKTTTTTTKKTTVAKTVKSAKVGL